MSSHTNHAYYPELEDEDANGQSKHHRSHKSSKKHLRTSFDQTDGPRIFAQPNNNNQMTTTTTVSAPSGVRLAQHMTIAGSFLDFALFVADVEHLKFLLDAGKENINYYTMLISLLVTSLVLQLIVVFLLFIVGFRKPSDTTVTTRNNPNPSSSSLPLEDIDLNGDSNQNQNNQNILETIQNGNGNGSESNWLNHLIICLVTLIAIVNVFVTVFGDRSATTMIDRFKADEAARAAKNLTKTF